MHPKIFLPAISATSRRLSSNYQYSSVLGRQAQRLMSTMGSVGAEVVGESGRHHAIQRILQDKEIPSSRVYLATAGKQNFILKEVHPPQFEYIQKMYDDLRACSHIRLAQDTVSEQSIFVYHYLSDNLLGLVQKDLPIEVIKRILRRVLCGLSELHDRNIVHTDVKANNILVDRNGEGHGIIINQVQVADIEGSAYVPEGYDIGGIEVGNRMWRSPEAHAKGRINKPSDMFSFGIVCIYAVFKLFIFAVDEEKLGEGEEPLAVILERHISYFGDEAGINGLMEHLRDSPWCEVLRIIRDGFNKDNPRKPFYLWKDGDKDIDADFKDLIGGLTNLDPRKRISAHEALEHKWFSTM